MMNPKKFSIGILGCGWMGTALGKHLNKNGFKVFGTTTKKARLSKLDDNGIEPVLLELGNHDEKKDPVIPDMKIAVLLMTPSVIWPHRHVLSRMIQNSSAEGLIMASSTSVYENLNRTVTESDASYLKSPHSGIVMLSMEDHFRQMNDISVCILRFSGLYGPGREPGRFLANRNQVSGADNPVNLVHLEDCVRAVDQIIASMPVAGTYNICADEHPKRREFYHKAALQLGVDPPIFTEEGTGYKIIDNSLFKEEFGFSYLHPDPMKTL
jgi:nucleoside-diphosphate-sugar epimerase